MSSTSSRGLQELILAGAKDIEVSHITGNLSDDAKRRSVSAFTYFVSTVDKSYGASVGQRLKPLEMNVWKEGSAAAYGETVFEITVDKDMCNVFGTLHGACAAYIIDPCSVSALITLGRTIGVDGTGVSQSMNLIWHRSIRLGSKLRVVSTSMSLRGRVRSSRCELWEGDNLCVSAVHSTVNPWKNGPSQEKSKL
ncbi:hypothetical protein K443DRAFT_683795 [Laccaria amethystina LaAM-08-1]|uniref:Thioesterase domain-containing protein n=1 Tax=Laccaria amethystina LaAM-08-1 TaxID=1095629 RepID=A0A0C9X9L5_9AGAR|nr:hypothetical protein K443DRAFT_683795 [Laccaria amethystina LaAM-08-1]